MKMIGHSIKWFKNVRYQICYNNYVPSDYIDNYNLINAYYVFINKVLSIPVNFFDVNDTSRARSKLRLYGCGLRMTKKQL